MTPGTPVHAHPWRDKQEGDGWTMYLGDCREVVPELEKNSIACTVTSPPYNTLPQKYAASGLHAERASGVNAWIAKAVDGYADDMDEDEYQLWINAVVSMCLDVSMGLVWVNHKCRYRDGVCLHPARWIKHPIYAEVIWDRGGSMALNCKRFSPSHETLLAFGRPHVWNDDLNTLMSVWRLAPQRSELHPCPFPTEIAARPIRSSTSVGECVLDPFAGSGTTGVACIETGRRFIGIEIDERYFKVACNRLRSATPCLFGRDA